MKAKKILVTGGSGFIGSHLVKRLVSLGADVTVTVKYKSIIDNVRLCPIWDDINVVECDLRNVDAILGLKKISPKFDFIFHLAAYNHVGDSFIQVNESLQSNLVATSNLMEHGPDFGRFIYTATSEVYGFQESVPFIETSFPFPISPYAVGKYAGELYARFKRHQTHQEIICLRPFNTFGPYQSERAVIPELIIKCLRGLPIETTQGRQTREFNFVANIVDGFLAAAAVDKIPEGPINIGAGEEISIRDLVKSIHELSESKSELRIGALEDRPTEIWRMRAANDRAREVLNWKPAVPFQEGLKQTIAWFREFLSAFYGDQHLKRL
jgi:UDP-glucose 4-epimerase